MAAQHALDRVFSLYPLHAESGPRPLQPQSSHNQISRSRDLERRLGDAGDDLRRARLLLSGHDLGFEFLTGYLIELSLSVDNLFVFLLIFSYFKVPAKVQHRVLFWGVMGALVMRLTMIFVGAALIDRFHWIIYIFGAFLVYTGIKMFRQEETDIQPEDNPVVRLVTRYIPITRHYEERSFSRG